MIFSTFLQSDANAPATITEIQRLHREIAASSFLGMYAYATQSGSALFDLAFDGKFWAATHSKWIFGIDYGRTQPQALKFICSQPNVEVRIHDGAYVLEQNGFVPRRDFHPKIAVLQNQETELSGIVVGSGNFSSNGLQKSVEAGASVITCGTNEFDALLRPTLLTAEQLWEQAVPVADILGAYEKLWSASFLRRVVGNQAGLEANYAAIPIFWIEAGYVTKNRGHHRPGNQIDLPRGMHRYFGFNPTESLSINSVIGSVLFETPVGESGPCNLRLGNNKMEKISLPIPEAHGFDIYDGKVLLFQRAAGRFVMRALEADDFATAFGDRLSEVRMMNSGRRFGHIT